MANIFRGPLYSNPYPVNWRIGHTSGEHAAFIVRPGKPPAPTNYYWPLTPDIREVRNYTFSEIPSRIPPPNKPLNQTDWPLPVPPVRPDCTWVLKGNTGLPLEFPFHRSSTDLTVPAPYRIEQTSIQTPFIGNIPAPNKPFNQTDWYLTPPPYFDRTWTNYQSSNNFPPFPVQGFNQTNWPNPTPPAVVSYTWINPGIIASTVQVPFNKYDWPNPTQPQYGKAPTWVSAGLQTFVTPPRPLNQYDWPLPGQFYRIDQTWIETGNNLPPIPPAGVNPFNQYFWPLTPAPTPIDPTWIMEGIGGGVVQPFSQTDWPLPSRYYSPDSTWINQGIRPTGPVQPPFFQTDWPILRDIRDFRSYTWSQYPGIIPPPNKPFNQYDWPTPKGNPRPDETWIWYFPNSEEAFPFNQYSWPLPGRYPTPDSTWINVQQLTPFVQSPFNQLDWPTPKGYPRPDGTWINPGIQQVVAVPLPIGTQYWQVPYGFPRPDGTWIYTPPPGVIPPPPIVILTGGQKWKDAVVEWKKDSDAKIKEAAAHMSSLGGKARAQSLTSKQRSAIASKAASIRWK